jgi:peptidoglycan/xylan/chitin deacetylase (PgdA/CDA1 family)
LKKIYKTVKALLFAKSSTGISILTYHGLVNEITNPRLQRNFHTVQQFEAHILYLKKKKFKFLNASELSYFIENPTEIKPQKMVCITFDDGYQNNLKAIEILEKNEASGTFFISTDSINSATSIWTVNLSLLMIEGSLTSIFFLEKEYSLATYELRLEVFNFIRNYLKKVPAEIRKALFDEVLNQFPMQELENLVVKHDYFKMLTWDEIRKVQNCNIQFQSHGHFHEIHNQEQNAATLKIEIMISKKVMEENLKNEVFLFAYPNGNFNSNSVPFLEETGYKAALTLGEKKYLGDSDSYCIPRITPNRKMDKFINQFSRNE